MAGIRTHFIRAFSGILLLIFCSSCSTTTYTRMQDGSEMQIAETSQWAIGNILHLNGKLWSEVWDQPDDYVLPPWLDKSLDTVCLTIDFPISLCADVITSPYQIWRYNQPLKTSGQALSE